MSTYAIYRPECPFATEFRETYSPTSPQPVSPSTCFDDRSPGSPQSPSQPNAIPEQPAYWMPTHMERRIYPAGDGRGPRGQLSSSPQPTSLGYERFDCRFERAVEDAPSGTKLPAATVVRSFIAMAFLTFVLAVVTGLLARFETASFFPDGLSTGGPDVGFAVAGGEDVYGKRPGSLSEGQGASVRTPGKDGRRELDAEERNAPGTAGTTSAAADGLEDDAIYAVGRRLHNKPKQSKCGQFFFTYCAQISQSSFYKDDAKSCALSTTERVHVCNQSPNRFATYEACRRGCVDKSKPLRRCLLKTLFTSCTREDIRYSWWFFDGHACRQWRYEHGSCPAVGSRVFRTRLECLGTCSEPGLRQEPCDRPRRTTCAPSRLRHPYFAVSRKGGRTTCLRASVTNLLTHRCLTGANRFDSLRSCNMTCLRSRPR